MSFKENLKAKIQLDGLMLEITSTLRETPGQRRLDKNLTQELLDMTDYEHTTVRDLQLYVRPFEGEIKKVLVLDNELPIYRTTVADVALRKSPELKEMFSIANIRKILNDQDVILSKGKESLKRIHTDALALLDLNYDQDDLVELVEDMRRGLEQRSLDQIQESLDLFLELLSYQSVSLMGLEPDLHIFARPKMNGENTTSFEHPLIFDEDNLTVALKKGSFSPQNDLDLAWAIQFTHGKEAADLKGIEVFEFLAELALEKSRA